MNCIYQLDHQKAAQYLHEKFDTWLCFTTGIVNDRIVKNGQFYCVGPEDFGKYDMYCFNGIKDTHQIPEISFTTHCIKQLKLKFIFENLTLMEDSTFWRTDMDYYFAEGHPFFYMDDAKSVDQIFEGHLLCGIWGFVPFITDVVLDFKNLPSKSKIDAETQQQIIDNTFFFFTTIYDDAGIMFWVKNGHECMIDELKKFINVNA